MPKFRSDFNPDEVPDAPPDDVFVCVLNNLEITPEASEKGYYMAVIRNQIDEGPHKGELIFDRIIVRHVTGNPVPMMAQRRLKKFVHATGGKIVQTSKGIGVDIPDNARYGVENRNDSYGPKANDYFHMSELPSQTETVAEAPTTQPAAQPEAESQEVSFEAGDDFA